MLFFSAYARDEITMAAPPSFMGDEFPGVTFPSALKAG
jgi:hypothetical protein